jgi:hypothetical protein
LSEDKLLPELKNRLRITWNDEDEYLKSILVGAMTYLIDLTSTSFDFTADSPPKTLVLERARYVYNNATDEFEINFKHELKRLVLNAALGKLW